MLDSWQIYNRRADVVVLLSELVNNALAHCQSDVEVAVTQPDRVIHVEVFDDAADEPPMLKEIDPHSEHGRGLHLVDAWPAVGDTVTSHPARRCGSTYPSETVHRPQQNRLTG